MKTMVFSLLVGLIVVGCGVAAAQSDTAAADGFARGNALLKKGDFEAALWTFAGAAGAPNAKPEYRQRFLLVRRVIKARSVLEAEKNPEKWWRTASALRNFYVSLGLHDQLLTLAKRMHAQRGSTESATVLADALLIAGRDAEAEKTLAALPRDRLTPHAKALLGVALARQKKIEPAKELLVGIAPPPESSPRFLCDVARLRVLCGDVAGGMATLTTAFEKTSPKGLANFRALVQATPEFAKLPASAGLVRVLATKSKVDESACSGGSSCGTCPKRGGCGGSKAPEKKTP